MQDAPGLAGTSGCLEQGIKAPLHSSIFDVYTGNNEDCEQLRRILTAIRFLWNATRGHRLRPWRSDYLRWRIETYSGLHAESIGFAEFARFLWQEKGRLLHFLAWTGQLYRTDTPAR
jgi:hypothetical protein